MVKAYNKDHPDALTILDEAMTTEPYAFAFAFGSEDLVAKINEIQAELIKDGTVAGLFEKFNAPYTSPIEK
jgi:ABC-type amino acid transport substrate-binding protein